MNKTNMKGQSSFANNLTTDTTCVCVFDMFSDLLRKMLANIVSLKLYFFLEDRVLFVPCQNIAAWLLAYGALVALDHIRRPRIRLHTRDL